MALAEIEEKNKKTEREIEVRILKRDESPMCVSVCVCGSVCVALCTHVKDPVVHVGVRWIMETLKDPTCTCRTG